MKYLVEPTVVDDSGISCDFCIHDNCVHCDCKTHVECVKCDNCFGKCYRAAPFKLPENNI